MELGLRLGFRCDEPSPVTLIPARPLCGAAQPQVSGMAQPVLSSSKRAGGTGEMTGGSLNDLKSPKPPTYHGAEGTGKLFSRGRDCLPQQGAVTARGGAPFWKWVGRTVLVMLWELGFRTGSPESPSDWQGPGLPFCRASLGLAGGRGPFSASHWDQLLGSSKRPRWP